MCCPLAITVTEHLVDIITIVEFYFSELSRQLISTYHAITKG